MNKTYIMLVITVLLILANFIMPGTDIDFQGESSVEIISPFSKFTEMDLDMYFLQNNNLVKERRRLVLEAGSNEMSVLEALKKGPKISTHQSPIGLDVHILSVELIDRILYVNLSDSFRGEDGLTYLRVSAIVNTLTEFDYVDQVQVLVNGDKIVGDQYDMSIPLSKNESLVVGVDEGHKGIGRRFIGYIERARYDLAYGLIDQQSKDVLSFDEFVLKAQSLRDEINGYDLQYYFSESIYTGYKIRFKFRLFDIESYSDALINDELSIEIIQDLVLIFDGSQWRVKFIK